MKSIKNVSWIFKNTIKFREVVEKKTYNEFFVLLIENVISTTY